jgi:purine nucleoside permease
MGARLPLVLLCILAASFHMVRAADPTPIPIKVVVIGMFEPGADQGDVPGEYQYWVERDHLTRILHFPQGNPHLRVNDQGVLGVLAGMGTAKAGDSIMALGLDPRFDLTKAYWLVAGIPGVDPEDASLGSAARGGMGSRWRSCLQDRRSRNSQTMDHRLPAPGELRAI